MHCQERGRPFEILIVEDDAASCYLMEAALKGTSVNHHVKSVNNGDAAMDLLKHRDSYASAPRPDLVFLDLNMPGKTGWDVLDEIKTDPLLKRIPVIVMTTSSDQQHVNAVYDRHANCYLRKPSDWNELCRQIRLIEEFWFGIVLWPTPAEAVAGH